MALLTHEEFILKCKKIHNEFYDYSKTVYTKLSEKVIIIDPDYGEFKQSANHHMRGSGHPLRAKNRRKTTKEFINDAMKIHGNLYDYHKVNYIKNSNKVIIIDPIYGEFKQTPNDHLSGKGHPKRGKYKHDELVTLTTDEFIKRANDIHEHYFDYSKVNYINHDTKVIIIDPVYGEFNQKPCIHLMGHGYPHKTNEQKIAYINILYKKCGEPVALKYGIESHKGTRVKKQESSSIYSIKTHSTFYFKSTSDCRNAENECAKLFKNENRQLFNRTGFLTKSELMDGWTETTSLKNIQKIIKIYEKFNGKMG